MSDINYSGQWTGTSDGGSFCVVNINDKGQSIDGRVSIYENAPLGESKIAIWTLSYFKGEKNDEGKVFGTVNPPTTYWDNGEIQTAEERKEFEDKTGISYPIETSFNASKDGLYKMEANWVSKFLNNQTRSDHVTLVKERLGSSRIFHQLMSWEQFKVFASNQHDGHIYRGQARDWRLQTSYHRTGHADLITYLDDKVPELENHINAYAKHEYDVKDDRSLGGLLNLAQHHGYPTPLLDWSKSPFVAAFFAYEDEGKIKKDGTVSIFIFNDQEWAAQVGRYARLRSPKLSVRTLELPGYGNARVLPQQSITMFSNIDDIEKIIQANEQSPGQFLTAVSIPSQEREKALKDLQLMGITWGSMFPSIEGVCKLLSERHFKNW